MVVETVFDFQVELIEILSKVYFNYPKYSEIMMMGAQIVPLLTDETLICFRATELDEVFSNWVLSFR